MSQPANELVFAILKLGCEETPLVASLCGRREHLLHKETERLLLTFEPDLTLAAILQEDGEILADLVDSIHSEILRAAMREAAIRYKCQADGTGATKDNSCTLICPLSMEVPALPDVDHGSSLFTRGETQVLCTATLGPPKYRILLNDPYNLPAKLISDKENKPYQDLPIGSLQYLRKQENWSPISTLAEFVPIENRQETLAS